MASQPQQPVAKINLAEFVRECGRQMKCPIIGHNLSTQLEDLILKLKATMHDLEATRRESRILVRMLEDSDDDDSDDYQFIE